jgi:hypothetical protein
MSETRYTNSRAYVLSSGATTVYMLVEIKLDLIPGFGHEPEDHIRMLFQNPYVQSADIVPGNLIRAAIGKARGA